MLFNTKFLDELTQKAGQSPRLRMNYNLHESLDLEKGNFGFQIPKNSWHKVEVKENGTELRLLSLSKPPLLSA